MITRKKGAKIIWRLPYWDCNVTLNGHPFNEWNPQSQANSLSLSSCLLSLTKENKGWKGLCQKHIKRPISAQRVCFSWPNHSPLSRIEEWWTPIKALTPALQGMERRSACLLKPITSFVVGDSVLPNIPFFLMCPSFYNRLLRKCIGPTKDIRKSTTCGPYSCHPRLLMVYRKTRCGQSIRKT